MSVKNFKHAQQYIGFNTAERPKGDFYATPKIAITKLLDYEKFGKVIWEPACGKGDISEVLKQYKYDVISTDLYDWGYGTSGIDFPNTTIKFNVNGIITNPPFNVPKNISYNFAIKSLEITKPSEGKVALLQRVTFLEGKKRQSLFKDYPFSKCLIFSSRLPRMHRYDYTGKPGGSMLAFAWFVWDWKHDGPPSIDWI